MPPKKQSPPPVGNPTVPPQKGVELITRQIEEGEKLAANGSIDQASYHKWVTVTLAYLEKIFGSNSPKAEEFRDFGMFGAFPGNAGEDWWSRWRAENCSGQLILLAGSIESLKADIELAVPATSAESVSHAKNRAKYSLFTATTMR